MNPKYQLFTTKYFRTLDDPRVDRTKHHPLINIITIAICAVIAGADTWKEIEAFGDENLEWFQEFLDLPYGIPCRDTFARLFARLDPDQFQGCFLAWIKEVSRRTKGEIVAFDGKRLRSSYDTDTGQGAIHMVSAWASENKLVLGQIKVDDKSNEITAIPHLLRVLALAGCIVTIDAMGTQKDIAAQIVKKKADYVLALKRNHPTMYDEVERLLERITGTVTDSGDYDYEYCETEERGHGRVEIRRYWLLTNLSTLSEKHLWRGLSSVGMVETERFCDGELSIERRYYLNSLKSDVYLFAKAVRAHWGIENQLHWVLDVAFREDSSRIRMGYAAQNFATLRHIVLNLLQRETSLSGSVQTKRKRAGWNKGYLTKILDSVPS